ncbi:DNA repair protein RecO [Candidatus Amesbacteria bacterium]|nr:DNA repair protein RecO [Candidatus Amesbacteria bacterium]
MRSYTDEGIVIKRHNFGEADKIITLYTKSLGKITLMARGVRKLISKRAGSLDLFNQIKFHAVSGRGEMDTLTEVCLLTNYSAWKKHLGRVNIAYQLCELVDKLTADRQSHPEIYSILSLFLSQISSLGADWELKIENCKLKILTELGYWHEDKKHMGNLDDLIESLSERPLHAHKILIRLR